MIVIGLGINLTSTEVFPIILFTETINHASAYSPPMIDIPTVPRAQELLDMAFKRAGKVSVLDKKPYFRVKKTETKKLQIVQDVLDSKILKVVKAFPSFDQLDPFTAEMMDIQFSRDKIRIALGRINGVRKSIRNIIKEKLKRIKREQNVAEITNIRKSAYGRLSSLILSLSQPLLLLGEVREVWRKMPTIDSETYTVVVAGFPNVGKSALVGALSTAAPEIAHYPFTTHDVILGHISREVRRLQEKIQIIDTPGILERPPEEHNEFEKRAFSALTNLAHGIIFVIDPSEYCGYPVDRQEYLLRSVKEAFSEIPIIHVVSKTDMEKERVDEFISRREEEWVRSSVVEGIGLDGIKEILFEKRGEFVSSRE